MFVTDFSAVQNAERTPPQAAARTLGARPGTHWKFALDLDARALKTYDPLPRMLSIASTMTDGAISKGRLFTILGELYNNALDHGVLNLDSSLKQDVDGFERYYRERTKRLNKLKEGFVKILLTHLPTPEGGELFVQVEDSGPGFNARSTQPPKHPSSAMSGRGILLLKRLCSQLHYHDNGNRVHAVLSWSH